MSIPSFDEGLEDALDRNPLPPDLKTIIKGILQIKNDLLEDSETHRTFLDYTVSELSNFQMKLNILRVTLGEYASKYQFSSDYSYIFRKWKHASAWTNLNKTLNNSGSKSSIPDKESAVQELIQDDTEREQIFKGYAGRMQLILQTTGSLDRAIATRIQILQSQLREAGNAPT